MTMMLRARPAASGIGTRRARRSTVVSALFAVALVAAGCGDDDGDAAEPGTTTSAGGTVAPGTTTARPRRGLHGRHAEGRPHDGHVHRGRQPRPDVSRGTGVTGGTELISIYDTLMRWNPETQEYEPRIAESRGAQRDFTTWTLKLRDDVTFGNGDPLTSAAVKASIERFQAPDSKSRWAALSRNIKTMDDARRRSRWCSRSPTRGPPSPTSWPTRSG